MRMPSLPRIVASAILLCAGLVLFPAYKHWVATRTWDVVNVPISLAPGHIRTGSFYVNFRGEFHINVELTGYEYWRDPGCHDYEEIQTQWRLTRDARTRFTSRDSWGNFWGLGDGVLRGTYLGRFDSSAGR
jgi:hypothetical protein